MRGGRVVTSVIVWGLSLSAQALAQGAPKPVPPPAPAPAPVKPAPAPAPAPPPPGAAPAPAPVAPAPAPAPGAPAPAPAPPALVPPPAAAPAPPPPPADAPPPAPPPPPVAQPTEPPPAEPLPEAQPADPELDLPPADEGYAEAGDAWYDLIEFSAFVDAYASFNFNFPKPQSGKNKLRAHDANNGFSLSWVGINASYPADPVGGTISLRFGPSAQQLGSLGGDSAFGMENVKQAFASWKPGGGESMLQLDLGKFDTPFGVEVAESHLNLNYTRSLLYNLAQPSFHTGLRANFAVHEAFDFRLLAVNGWNNTVDNNVGKTFGGQGTFHLRNADGSDMLTASLGYMIGPEHEDTATINCAEGQAFSPSAPNGCVSAPTSASAERSGVVDRASANTEGLKHLVDLVVVADPIDRLRLVLNANYGLDNLYNDNTDEYDSASFWGVLLGARVGIVDEFAVAARGEYVSDPKGYLSGYYDRREELKLVSGTLTLELLPADFLTVRLDNRIDWSDKQIFDKAIRDMTGTQFTTTLGVVAHTD